MSTVLANFLFEAVNFLLLAAALAYFFFKPVRSALDRERDERAAAEAEAARARAEADDLVRKARETWSAADAEIADQRERLLEAARAEASQLKEHARVDQAAERLAFDRQLRAARAAQTDAVASAVGEVAAASVLTLLADLDGPDLDAALVRAACSELEGTPGTGGGRVEVESARPLSPDAVASLTRVLGEGFTRRTVPELGAGVRVTTGVGQVDATAAGIARLAAREIAQRGRYAGEGVSDD